VKKSTFGAPRAASLCACISPIDAGTTNVVTGHPNEDEWQHYVSGKGRMMVFAAGGRARTMDFEEGDVGYIDQSIPRYLENTGDTDLIFIEVFPTHFIRIFRLPSGWLIRHRDW
jgi:oxalate decarboxylase